MNRRLLVIIVFLIGGALEIFAQGVSDHTWYFGTTGNGIRFNIGDNTAAGISGNAGLGLGGAAVGTNPWTGEVMFYTDGNTVYDVNNQFMPNGLGLNGNPASSSSVVVTAVPGTTDEYYIFTNSSTAGTPGVLTVSVVDMNLFGNAAFPLPASGDLAFKNQNIPVMPGNLAQGMIAIPNSNCDGFWLITQNSGTDEYYVLEVAASGLTNLTTYGGIGLPIEAASFAYHEGRSQIVVTPEDPENNVAILDFDNTTGDLAFFSSLLNTGQMFTANEAIYDAEWSFNGRFLYVSTIGETGIPASVIQYNVNLPINTPVDILPGPIHRSYGLKMAPDSSIYHLYQETNGGPMLMGRIMDTDSVGALVIYEEDPFSVSDYNAKQFPATLPAFEANTVIDFDVTGTCSNVPTIFSASVTPDADSVFWDFGDGSVSNLYAPIYTYENGGAKNVSLTTFLDGKSSTFAKSVNITQFDLQIQLVQDTVACKCELPVNLTEPECAGSTSFFSVTADISGGTATSVVWSNGQTGNTLSPDSAGYYYVVATDATGCSAYAGVNVREYDLQDQRTNIWYFGQNAGIDFNTPTPTPLDDGAMTAPEGCSAISDRNGQIIFYTDGSNVYDKNHNQIATGIGGDPGSSQSALIMPLPNDETIYYIFTTQEVYGTGTYELKYSIFDIKRNNGDGAIISDNNLLFIKSTERIAASNNWLLAHEYGNSTFRAYPMTDTGLGTAVISEIGATHSFNVEENGQGYMKFSSNGKVAVALSDPGTANYIELFDFDNATGELSNYKQIDVMESAGQIYGVAFSPGGNKVFATILNGTPNLVEYFIDSIDNPYLRQKLTIPGQAGAIQSAPDGQLYVAIEGSSSLGSILASEDTTQNSAYNPSGFILAGGTTSTLGLPSFVQSVGNSPQPASMFVSEQCFGDETMFTVTGTDIIDEFTWFFGDGGSDTGDSTTHVYAAPGDYTVAVQITNRCGLDLILTQDITISDLPSPPTLNLTENICLNAITLQAADPGDPQFADYTYLWSTGETTNTIQVDEQSIIDVTITNAAGCTSSGQVLVADNRPAVDFGEDQTVCQLQTVIPLDAGNVGANYSWTVNGGVVSSTQTLNVDTNTPGTFTYEVTVTDPLTGCVVVEDITFDVIEVPVFTINITDSPGCNADMGEINIDITTAGSYSYFINGPDFRNGINQIGPINTITESNLPIGTYFVTIQDEVSNCQVTQSITINDVGSAMIVPDPVSNPGCSFITFDVDVNGTYDGSAGFNYTLTNLDNTTTTNGFSAVEPFTTVGVIPGNYSILIEDVATSCTELTGPFVVVESTQAVLTVNPIDECADPVQISVSSDAVTPVYSWVGPNGFVGNGATINPPESGDYTVTVNDATLNRCPATEVVSVVVDVFDPVINIVGDPCSGQVVLEVDPAIGNYSYSWTGPSSGGQSLVVGPAESGTYSVTVRSQDTGCEKTSPSVAVNVSEPLTVGLASTFACDDGNPYTVTATASTPGVTYKWFKDGILVPDSISNTFSSLESAFYKVEVENANGCTAEADHFVILVPYTVPDLPNRLSICDDPDNPNPETSQVDLNVGALFSDFVWKLDGTIVSTDPIYTATESGTYTVELVNPFGCPATDETVVVTECDPIITAPNAFSPNGNNENDEFFIFSTFVSDDFEIFMYNRWGELVFQSDDKNFRWNGGYNNHASELLPGGTYVYVIRFVSEYQPERGEQEQRGGVLLLR